MVDHKVHSGPAYWLVTVNGSAPGAVLRNVLLAVADAVPRLDSRPCGGAREGGPSFLGLMGLR